METVIKSGRKIAVCVVGGLVLVAGVAMMVLPGPAFVVIPLGLGILATEFQWARDLLERFKQYSRRFLDKARAKRDERRRARDEAKVDTRGPV
jgi:tellurite resistance protein TerC